MMKSARHELPLVAHQLSIALDSAKLQGMTPAERREAIVLLAGLLQEAAGAAPAESGDERV
jgi:hypothetical protein